MAYIWWGCQTKTRPTGEPDFEATSDQFDQGIANLELDESPTRARQVSGGDAKGLDSNDWMQIINQGSICGTSGALMSSRRTETMSKASAPKPLVAICGLDHTRAEVHVFKI